MCIEIDISQTPAHEIVLNLQGREVRQIVKWDRIPLYCHECKHVGHSSEVCYANGQREKPAKRDYKLPNGKKAQQGMGDKGGEMDLGESCKVQELRAAAWSADQEVGVGLNYDVEKEDGLIQGDSQEQDGGGFQRQGKRQGKQGKGSWDGSGLKGGSPGEGGLGGSGGSAGGEGRGMSENRFSILSTSEFSLGSLALDSEPSIRYLKMLPNGDFDPKVYEDEKEWDCEEYLEDESMLQQGRPIDKRGAATELTKLVGEDNKLKKGRLNVVASTATV